MREILFRGKRLDNGEWVEGYVYRFHPICRIRHWLSLLGKYGDADVAPATVGQYTGLTDKHGKRIFEGDFVKAMLTRDCGGGEQVREETGAIGYDTIGMIGLMDYLLGVTPVWSDFFHELSLSGLVTDFSFEVIGNIHDNPELIGGGNDA